MSVFFSENSHMGCGVASRSGFGRQRDGMHVIPCEFAHLPPIKADAIAIAVNHRLPSRAMATSPTVRDRHAARCAGAVTSAHVVNKNNFPSRNVFMNATLPSPFSSNRSPDTRHGLMKPGRMGVWLLLLSGLTTPAVAADWYAAPAGGGNVCSQASPCTIQGAINNAGTNDTVHVAAGSYAWVATLQISGAGKNGLRLVGENSPFAAASTPANVLPASDASELQAATATGLRTGMIWIAGAQDVTIENLLLQVDHGRSNEGIVTTGDVNGLILRNNFLRIYSRSGGQRNAISINMHGSGGSASDRNSTGQGPGPVAWVTLEGNVVQPSAATSSATSARAVVADYAAGVFRNNQFAGSTQDVRLRYLGVTSRGTGIDFHGNHVFGAGFWLMTPNDQGSAVHIHDNHFIAPGSPGWPSLPLNASAVGDPDFSSLKLVGSSNPTIIEDNEFLGYANKYRGLWIQNWPNATVQGNTFTPNITYNGISTAVLVGNKEVWNGAPTPRHLGITLLDNAFAGGYAGANSRAIVFVNDNDASGTATAGSLLVGDGNAAHANSFAAGLRWYVGLDEQTCNYSTGFPNSGLNCSGGSSPLGPGIDYRSGSNGNTQGRPFRFDVSALGNRFAGKLVDEMSNAEFTAIAGKVFDKNDNAALGTVDYGNGPRITTGTITFSPTTITWDGNAHTISAALQEDAAATCVVTPAALTNAGTHSVSATCTSSTYNVTGTGTVTVAPAEQAITGFQATPANPTYSNGGSFTVSATGGASGEPVVFASSTAAVCVVAAGGTINMLSAGTCTLTANQAGSGNYNAAPQVSIIVPIAKGVSTVEWGALSFAYTNAAHAVAASVSGDSASSCTVNPASVGPEVGSYTVTATACNSDKFDVPGLPVSSTAVVGGTKVVHRVKDHVYFASVAAALADADTLAGDTIEVAPGVYSGGIVLTKGVHLVGSMGYTPLAGPTTPPSVIIDGGGVVADGITIGAGVTGATVSGFEVRNFTQHCVFGVSGNHGLVVEQSVLHHCGHSGVWINGDVDNVTISSNEVHHFGTVIGNAGRGIVVWNGVKRDITISNNWVHDGTGCCGIELQDGTATGAWITDNVVENVGDSGMSFVQLTSGSLVPRANVISGNQISNTGRFGIEIKIPNGTGAASGDGAILVENNTIDGAGPKSLRDRAGIAVHRRAFAGAPAIDVTTGVIVQDNTVGGFKTVLAGYEGYGIVMEGLGSTIQRNTLTNNDIGFQLQQGNPDGPPPGDAIQNAMSDWFNRGNAPFTCASVGEAADANAFSGNTTDQREVPIGVPMNGSRVLNQTTGARYCSINAAIAAAVPGEVLVADPGVYEEAVVIDRAITLRGAQAGTAAGPSRSSDPGVASILVPPVAASGMAYNMSATLGVMEINASNVTVDGFVLDGDNPAITTGLPMGSADPDVDSGVFATGDNIRFVNNEMRNLVYGGFIGYNSNTSEPARQDNEIAHNWIHNIDSPSTWGIGVAVMWNYYADIHHNRIDDARIGIQTNYYFKTAPVPAVARIADNTLSVSTTGIYHNYHTADQTQASPFSITGNVIGANVNPAASGVWSGIFVQALYDASGAVVSGNAIDGSALAGAGRLRLGYGISNIVSSVSSSLALVGGSVTGVEYGALATDGAYFTGAVNDYTISNVAFSDVAIAAIAVEDTLLAGSETIDNAVRLTVGAGNVFAGSVVHHGALSGTNASIEFAPGVALLDRMLVKAGGLNYRNGLADSNGNVRSVGPGVVNHAIADAAVNGTVTLEAGTFAQNVVVNKTVSLVGPHAGVHGNDTGAGRGAGEAIVSPSSGIGIDLAAPDAVVNGLTIGSAGGHAVRRAPGEAADNLSLINNRILNVTNGSGVFSEPGGSTGAGDGFLIAHNLFGNIAGSGSQNGRGVVLFKGTANARVDDNDFSGPIQLYAIQVNGGTGAISNVAITGNRITNTSSNAVIVTNTVGTSFEHNLVTGVPQALFFSDKTTDLTVSCNVLSAAGSGLSASDQFVTLPPNANSNIRIFHNAISGGTVDLNSTMAQGLTVGSNWYDGAAPAISGAAIDLLVADPLPANPIGDPLCGNNMPHEIVAYGSTSPQSTAVDTAFAQGLRARVQDVLGGAVTGQPVTYSDPSSGSVAGATLGALSGTTNYNGELITTATANSIAGSYTVTAASGSLTPDASFALENTQGTATVAVTSPTVIYDGSPKRVVVTATPAGLEGDVQIVYTQGVTTVATCAATDLACGPVNAGVYTATATIVGNPNYAGSGTGTLTINRASTTIEFQPDPLSFVYNGSTHAVNARLVAEAGTSCAVTGTVGPNVAGSPYTVNAAACVGTNYEAPANSATATVTPQPTTISFSHLVQAYDGSPKSVVAATAPTPDVALAITYNGSPTPPTAIGSYAVAATITDGNYALSGGNTATMQIVAGTGDIALVLTGPVDPIHVGDPAQYAATMLANPALHTGELYGYRVVLSKSGGDPLALSDLATMEVWDGSVWQDASALMALFTPDGSGGFSYDFPDGIPGYTGGFPILDPSWTWNVRFSYATPGTYTLSTTLTDGMGGAPVTPTVAASIATVVVDALPANDIHLALGGPAESIEVAQVAEYTGTMIADPSLHVGEHFFVKVNVAKSGGNHALVPADLATMEIYVGGIWTALPPGEITQPGGPGTDLVYYFPKTALPGGFEITSPSWTWNFRFGYADTGTYTATAQVIHAADEGNPLAHVFATAAVSTTVIDATPHLPDLGLLLTGPLNDVELGDAAQYTGTLLAEPALYAGDTFWVRIRIHKTGGSHALVATDLAKMELYQGGWQDHTATLQPLLVADGADLVYYFPQPNAAFPIDNAIFSWNFRFTYGDTGTYTATADLIDAAEPTPLTAPSLASAGVTTNVVDTPEIHLDVQGAVAGVVGTPVQYVGTLTADPLPPAANLYFVEVRIQKNGTAASASDISKSEIFWGGAWVDPTEPPYNAVISWTVDPLTDELVYLFPQPLMMAGFPINSASWTWQFRFTYADDGVYTAKATVITADGSATPVSNTENIATDVQPMPADVMLTLNGPVAGVEVEAPTAYIGRLRNLGGALTENGYVKVRIEADSGPLAASDVTLEVWDGTVWVTGTPSVVSGGLELVFPDLTGFAIPAGFDYTHQFRITYHRTGIFHAMATVLGVSSHNTYAGAEMFTQVVAQSVQTASVIFDTASLHATFDGNPHAALATTVPNGLTLDYTYNGSSTAPTAAGSYVVVATVNDTLYTGSASAVLTIDKAAATVTINPADLHQSTPVHAVDASASVSAPLPAPTGTIDVTYDGSHALPTLPGTYTAVATLVDPNYTGSASAVLVVGDGAAVTVTLDSAPAMELVGANAPYTDLLDYLGTVGNSGAPTSQEVHVELTVVRIDDGNGTGGMPVAIAADDVLACVHDPAGWAAQEPGNHHGCPNDYASLFLGQVMGSHNGRTATIFRYPNLAANDAVMPTVDPPVALGMKLAFKPGEYQIFGSIVGADGHVYASTAPARTTVPDAHLAYNGPTSGQAEDALLSQTRLTNTGGRTDGNVIVKVTLADVGSATLAPADAEFAYQYGGSFLPLPWTQAGNDLVTWFGPPTGFPLEDGHDATTSAQAIFHREGSYTVTYDVVDAATHAVLFTSTEVTPIVIGPNMIGFSLSDLSQVYDGTPRAVTVTPASVPHQVVYEPMTGPSCPGTPGGSNTTPPTDAGSYCAYVSATGVYQGSAQGTLVVAKDAATVTLDDDDGTVDGTIHRAYDGTLQVVYASSAPAVASIDVTYNGDATPPEDAGTYSVVATVVDPNYTGTASATLIVAANGGASIVLDGAVSNIVTRTYNGLPQAVTATTTPSGISYGVTYVGDGGTVYPLSTTPPTNAGQYHVVATTTDANYAPVSATGTLVIAQANAGATITLDDDDGTVDGTIHRTYGGGAQSVTATTNPSGLAYAVQYAGIAPTIYPSSSVPPTNVGSYAVTASITDPNYTGITDSATLVIAAQSGGVVTFDQTSFVYDGTPQSPVAAMAGDSNVTCTYAWSQGGTPLAGAPIDAGSYDVTATCTGSNTMGSASTPFTIAKATAQIFLSSLSHVYSGTVQSASVTTVPSGLSGVDLSYGQGGNPATPIDAGAYDVVAALVNPNYTLSAPVTAVLTISKATATVSIGNTVQTYDGTPKPVAVTTAPSGLTVTVTYDGSGSAPIAVGDYAVVAMVNEANYAGQATATLRITTGTVTISDIVWVDNDATSIVYNGSARAAKATVSGSSLTPTFTYNGSSTAPTNAGTYHVVATVDDGNLHGTASAILAITQIPAGNSGITLTGGTYVYNNQPHPATVANPNTVAYTLGYQPGGSSEPFFVGTYIAMLTVTDPNYAPETMISTVTVLDDTTSCAIFCDGFEDGAGPRPEPLAMSGGSEGDGFVVGWIVERVAFGRIESALEFLDASERAMAWIDTAMVTDGQWLRLRWIDVHGVEHKGEWVSWTSGDLLEYQWDLSLDGLVLRFGSNGRYPEALVLSLPPGSPIPEAVRALKATGRR